MVLAIKLFGLISMLWCFTLLVEFLSDESLKKNMKYFYIKPKPELHSEVICKWAKTGF